MDEETVEFECTDCSATVPADAKACPKCGANFEETPKEDDLEYTCSECGTIVQLQEKYCSKCGATLYIEYYSVSTSKLAILSICSFGIYQIYWVYKNWALIKEQDQKKIIPILRAVFAYFFCYKLFKMVLISAQSVGYEHKYSPGLLTISFIIITLFYKLPDPLWLITLFSYVPLLSVQRAINFNNAKVTMDFVENGKYATGEVVLAILGGAILLLAIIGTFSSV